MLVMAAVVLPPPAALEVAVPTSRRVTLPVPCQPERLAAAGERGRLRAGGGALVPRLPPEVPPKSRTLSVLLDGDAAGVLAQREHVVDARRDQVQVAADGAGDGGSGTLRGVLDEDVAGDRTVVDDVDRRELAEGGVELLDRAVEIEVGVGVVEGEDGLGDRGRVRLDGVVVDELVEAGGVRRGGADDGRRCRFS